MTRIGVERATIHETSHHPIVTGEWMHAGADAPTVLVYCHYDVQPTDPLDEWIRPPFEPRHEDGRVFARGAGDDKGQLFMHLKAVEAWMSTAGRLPVNLRFFFEGDEEVGSEPIEAFIDEHADLLNADVCVVSDGDTFDDEGTPAIGYGLRGIAYWEVRVHGPAPGRPLRAVRRRRRQPGQRARSHAGLPDRCGRPLHRPRLLRPRPRADR